MHPQKETLKLYLQFLQAFLAQFQLYDKFLLNLEQLFLQELYLICFAFPLDGELPSLELAGQGQVFNRQPHQEGRNNHNKKICDRISILDIFLDQIDP